MTKRYNIINTNWGYVVAIWSNLGLWKLSFPFPDKTTAWGNIAKMAAIENNDTTLSSELDYNLKMYFSGSPVKFKVPIDWTKYTPYQTTVLKYTATIPYNEVTSYGNVAAAIGSPKASRAVGGALHINRTPIVVPCHRVIGANGSLTGFGGGIELKKSLLQLEQGTSFSEPT